MKILYLANIRLPTEKAHGVQIMKMCEAFAKAGHTVTLVVPTRKTPITDDPFVYYGVKRSFTITRMPTLDTVSWGRIGFWIQTLSFSLFAARYVKAHPADIVYSRDEMALYLAWKSGASHSVWEAHTGAWNFFSRRVASVAQAIVTISAGLKNFYELRGVPSGKIIVAHDGVDLETFSHPESREQARARLGLPLEKKIVLYAGRLDGWKGVDTLCEVAALLPDDILVAVIGGEPEQVAAFSARYPRVRFLGFRPYRELADNQMAGDVLVLPNTGKDIISVHFTSPLKLFSYMASGVPIVSSDLPSIREVVSDADVFFATPDDPKSLALAIETALGDPHVASIKAQAAREEVAGYTWSKRAERILAAFN